MPGVFLSHSSLDKEFVRRLAADLTRTGISVWLDEAEIKIGDSLVEKISHGIMEAEFLGVVLSTASVSSKWVQVELNTALNLEINGRKLKVLPLRLDDAPVPPLLTDKLHADFRDPKRYSTELRRLVAAILPATPSLEPEMVLIPAGRFIMGSDPTHDSDAQKDETPAHSLAIDDFYLGKYQITTAQYHAFALATKRQPWRGRDTYHGSSGAYAEIFDYSKPLRDIVMNLPITWVTWYDAVAYCKWLADTTGQLYTLPSEAEWEKGARGIDGRIYPWGDEWIEGFCQAERTSVVPAAEIRGQIFGGTIVSVQSYARAVSPYGLHQMAGNVSEWTRTIWGTGAESKYLYPYVPDDGRERMDVRQKTARVVRGGSFLHPREEVRCAYRNGREAWRPSAFTGFRVARHIKGEPKLSKSASRRRAGMS